MPRGPIPGQPWEIPGPPEGYNVDDFNFSVLGYLNAKYIWNTWGDNCRICNAMRGKVYTLDFWINAGITPGFHLGCDCSLKRVDDDTLTSDPDFFGVDIPTYARMWLPRANMVWDPEFLIQPWQMSLVEDIEQMHLKYGADTPFSEILKMLGGGGFFSHGSKFYGDTAGWRVLATRQHYEMIDGSYTGNTLFTLKHLFNVLEPFWLWFERKWHTDLAYHPNHKFFQMKSPYLPPQTLRPAPLRPHSPMQSYHTEVE